MSLLILKSGLYSSVQDQGRWGFQRMGVPVSGCMDKQAASVANMLCGNPKDRAVIEFVMHGAQIRFDEDHLVAFSGSGAVPVSEGKELLLNRAIFVPKNSIIDLRYTDKGCRLYMAVGGGIDTPVIMGSRSAYEPAGAGAKLKAGDALPVGIRSDITDRMISRMAHHGVSVAKWGAVELLEEFDTDCIRVLRGPEWEQFNKDSQIKWSSAYYQITHASDRMGYKLSGEPLLLEKREEMISTAVCAGTIQVIPDGSPLILMADAQTTGGYPRIAQVIDADMSICAQKRPGDQVRFREVSETVAQELYLNRRQELARLERTVGTKFSI